jgi:transposase
MLGHNIRKCLELLKTGLSPRKTAETVGISISTCKRWKERAKEVDLTYEAASHMSDAALHTCFIKERKPRKEFYEIDLNRYAQLREKGYSVQDLYEKYTEEAQKSGLQHLKRTAFFEKAKLLQGHTAKKEKEMVQQWAPGEYMQIDYAGDKITLRSSPDGKQYKVSIFVCVLCHSRLQFWYATPDTTTKSWLEGIIGALEYFKGAPKYVIHDNDVALVKNAVRGETDYVQGFKDLCNFYHIEPSPARVGTPRDKGMVESCVKNVTDRFIKKISPGSLNTLKDVQLLLSKELEEFNQKVMAKYKISRKDWFEGIERKKLQKLPKNKYTYQGELLLRKVDNRCCVSVDGHDYLVPKEYFGLTVGVIRGNDGMLHIVEPDHREELCVYQHFELGKPDLREGFIHIRSEFRAVGELTPVERLNRAKERCIGTGTYRTIFMKKWISKNSHKEAGAQADQLNAFAKELESFGNEDVEAACKRCVELGSYHKEDVLGYLNNPAPLSDGPKKKSSNRGACLRTFSKKDKPESIN